jgi:RimJ/RimL family protein N-acetyltransferase
MADADRLLEWRNEPAVRAASFSTGEVTVTEHRAWLLRKLTDPACRLMIVRYEGRSVGQVRLDIDGDEAEISIALTEQARGRGVGREAIRLAVAQAPEGVARMVAQVKPDNPASLAAFEAAGFERHGENDHAVVMVCRPPR